MTATPELLNQLVEKHVGLLRKTCKIPDGKPCDEIERVTSAGVKYIINGEIVDDPVYHPVTGFVYASERIKHLVRELVTDLVIGTLAGPMQDDIAKRILRFGALSR